ncbi:hypothetical protein IMG5_067140, partial [Ichthyophthirius multifiliis]
MQQNHTQILFDILINEVCVCKQIEQHQHNLKNQSDFNPETSFQALKRLNNPQIQMNDLNGDIRYESLQYFYNLYNEKISQYESQAIIQRYNQVSNLLDYDTFLKILNINPSSIRRRNQIFQHQQQQNVQQE